MQDVLRKTPQRRVRRTSVQVRDTLRYTAFLGAFAGVYVAVDEGLAALFGNERCAELLTLYRRPSCESSWVATADERPECDMQHLQVAGGGGRVGSRPHHPADRVMLQVHLMRCASCDIHSNKNQQTGRTGSPAISRQ